MLDVDHSQGLPACDMSACCWSAAIYTPRCILVSMRMPQRSHDALVAGGAIVAEPRCSNHAELDNRGLTHKDASAIVLGLSGISDYSA
jgi:hypothetical protein